jgi:hypothetical protein
VKEREKRKRGTVSHTLPHFSNKKQQIELMLMMKERESIKRENKKKARKKR